MTVKYFCCFDLLGISCQYFTYVSNSEYLKNPISRFKMLVEPLFGGLLSSESVSGNSEKGLGKGEDGDCNSTKSSATMRQVYYPQSWGGGTGCAFKQSAWTSSVWDLEEHTKLWQRGNIPQDTVPQQTEMANRKALISGPHRDERFEISILDKTPPCRLGKAQTATPGRCQAWWDRPG